METSVIFLAILAAFAPEVFSQFEVLPEFNVEKDRITVSGFSSGASFATQFHVAFSSRIGGCGTWAGVPYLCTPQAFSACQYFPSVIDVDALVADTHEMFANGSIDDPANMADDRIYAFTGTRDMVARWL